MGLSARRPARPSFLPSSASVGRISGPVNCYEYVLLRSPAFLLMLSFFDATPRLFVRLRCPFVCPYPLLRAVPRSCVSYGRVSDFIFRYTSLFQELTRKSSLTRTRSSMDRNVTTGSGEDDDGRTSDENNKRTKRSNYAQSHYVPMEQVSM